MKTDERKGIVVYGDISIDFQIRTSFRPEAGQDAKVERVTFEPGGSAANCAAVAANLGVPTTFIGFVGSDSFGDIAREDLKRHRVSVSSLPSIEGDTGITTAIIEPNGERTFYSYRGVNASGELAKLPADFFNNTGYLHISGYSFQDAISRNNALYLMEEAQKANVFISLDPSFWFSKEFHNENPGVLADVNLLFPSQEEAGLLSGVDHPETASKIIREMGPEIVLITLGPEGCYIASDEFSGYLPAAAVADVVDTTGAGDAVCAGFLTGQVMGLGIRDSAKVGSFAASQIIAHSGGHTGAPGVAELMAYLGEGN